MIRHIAANALTFLVLAMIAMGVAFIWVQNSFTAEGPLQESVIVPLNRGDGINTISERLEEAGAIESASIFRVMARYRGDDGNLKFGDYEIPAGASMEEVLALVTSGRSVSYQVTIPEGLTSWQIVAS